uniref:Reverse transcriptase zinc-binding domain-containing protein n=1 Tax=Cannabis sativa TaxID=3483 RepID=A0A803P208_CANSA
MKNFSMKGGEATTSPQRLLNLVPLPTTIRIHEDAALFSGIKICRGAPSFSHLLFAVDSMVFVPVTSQSSEAINRILHLYFQASGQSVNRDKSSILFSPNTSPDTQSQFRSSLLLNGEGFISKYLGVPHCIGRVKNSIFHYLIQKVSSKLNVWNEKLFSRAGKETLIKSVIQAIPSFAMSCFRIPKSTCASIQSLTAKFWWGSNTNHRKIHWKSWSAISASKFFGGLGFRSLTSHNQALLAKQAWRIWSNPDSLLHSLLKARYFKSTDFLQAPTGHNPSFTWRSLQWGSQLLKKGLIWKICTGSNIPISASNWIPQISHPTLLHPIDPSLATVSFFVNQDRSWNTEKLYHFLPSFQAKAVLTIPLDLGHSDSLIWGFHHSGILTVKSAYHLAQSIVTNSSPSSSIPSPFKDWWKFLWTLKIPPKIKLFTWKAFKLLLPCALNLFHKHAIPSACCFHCGGSNESVSHALLHCPRVKTIWHQSNFKQFFADNHRLDIRDFYLHSLESIPKDQLPVLIGIIWQIWNTRNAHLFQRQNLCTNVQDYVSNFLQDYQEAQIHSSVYTVSKSPSLQPSALQRLALGASSPIFAEAQALAAGLQWCLSSNLTPEYIFSNCLNLVSKVKGNWHDHSPLSTLVHQIRTFLSRFPETSLLHVSRQHNDKATLAKQARV